MASIAAVVAFIAILVWFSLIQGSSHPAVGKWRYGFLLLKVEPDKVATINSIVCSWRKRDQDTIWIQPEGKIEIPGVGTIGAAFELTVQTGGQKAVMDVFGYPMTLDRADR